jgi:small subunit ribosomal protein S21
MTKNYRKKGLYIEVKGENINIALRKFKKKVDESNKLVEVIKKEFYEKPTTERKRKQSAAKSRWLKKLKEESLPKKNF